MYLLIPCGYKLYCSWKVMTKENKFTPPGLLSRTSLIYFWGWKAWLYVKNKIKPFLPELTCHCNCKYKVHHHIQMYHTHHLLSILTIVGDIVKWWGRYHGEISIQISSPSSVCPSSDKFDDIHSFYVPFSNSQIVWAMYLLIQKLSMNIF